MTPEEIRQQLHEQARSSQQETIEMYEDFAATDRARGDIARAEYWEQVAERERRRPLPNAA